MKSTFVGNQAQTRIGVDDPGLTRLRVKKSKHSKIEGRNAVRSEPPWDSYLRHGSDANKVYVGEHYNLISVLP